MAQISSRPLTSIVLISLLGLTYYIFTGNPKVALKLTLRRNLQTQAKLLSSNVCRFKLLNPTQTWSYPEFSNFCKVLSVNMWRKEEKERKGGGFPYL